MKLRGVSLTLPVCDWRFFVAPCSREPFLSSLNVKVGDTYIKGFGSARERKKVRLEWRSGDTIFYDCVGAISLPQLLPNGARVTHVVRRVYVDGRALVRFELAIYTNPEHRYPEPRQPLERFARDYWETQVTVIDAGAKQAVSLFEGLPRLVKRFEEKTSLPHELSAVALCCALEPHLQVIAEVSEEERPGGSQPIDPTGKVFLSVRPLRLKAKPAPVDTAFLTYAPGFVTRPKGENFDTLRRIRADAAWLHTELQLLTELLRGVRDRKVAFEVVYDELMGLAGGLRSAPGLSGEDDRRTFARFGTREK